MKKAVFIILFALPLFLMVVISVAGRLIIQTIIVPVESVVFLDNDNHHMDVITVSKGQEIELRATVLPELATNKNVRYTVETGSQYVSYDQTEGKLTASEYGTAKLIALSVDGGHRAEIVIYVSDKDVTGITISTDSRTLSIGEQFTLAASIIPSSAQNKNVVWSSSNPLVASVSETGRVTAHAASTQPVIITVTSEEGGFTAHCEITVLDQAPEFSFYRNGVPFQAGQFILVTGSQVNLLDYVRINGVESSESDGIVFTVSGGNAVVDGNILTINQAGVDITVTASVNGKTCTARFRQQ